jgi:SAM-dependent methyltransferase
VTETPSPAQIVATWNVLGPAYDALCHRWPLFTAMADRLVAAVPADATAICDLAGGSGLLSARLLAARPGARVTLVEPANAMRACARARLGDRVRIVGAMATALASVLGPVDAVVCSASMHLLDESEVFAAVASVLRPGGVFAFNLWWHSFDATCDAGPTPWWDQVLEAEIQAAGFDVPPRRERPPPRARSRASLTREAARHGLELRALVCDEDEVEGAFFLEFGAMRPAWLAALGAAREGVLARARARCARPVKVVTVRFVFGYR